MEKAPIIELRAQIASAHPVITHQVLRDWDFELLDVFHEIADHLFNPRLPTLQNTDGDPLSLHKLVFDLNAVPQAAFDALKHWVELARTARIAGWRMWRKLLI